MFFFQYASTDQRYFLAVIITVVVSICIHELAHGVVAVWLGDRTPIETGHMTLNPAVHMGLFSVICLFTAGMAWGLMPVDPTRLRGKYGDALASAAGPFSNLILALLSLGGLGLWQRFDERATEELSNGLQNLTYLLWVFGLTNIALTLLNLVPIPPLDGSRILSNFSRSFAELSNTIMTNGGGIPVMVLVLTSAGKVVYPAAGYIGTALLISIRGD